METDIKNSPAWRVWDAPLRNGQRALLRQQTRDDADLVRSALERLSEEGRYLRFHTPLPRIPHPLARALSQVRDGERVGVLAFIEGEPVGLAQWVRDALRPQVGEFALSVTDESQRLGVGGALVRAAAELAQQAGITHLECHVHHANSSVHEWASRMGAIKQTRGVWQLSVRALQNPVVPHPRGMVRWSDAPRSSRSAARAVEQRH